MTATPTRVLSAEVTLAREQRGPLQQFLARLLRYRPGIVSLGVLVFLYMLAFVVPHLLPYSPDSLDLTNMLSGPNWQHLLGTDENGRDVLARLLYGGQISLTVGIFAVLIADTVGVLLGAVAGYFGKISDTLIMRITDTMLAIPGFLLLLVILSLFSPSLGKIELAIGLTSWMTVSRLVRGEILRYKDAEFVQAAKAMGASDWRIIFRHLLPQTVSPVVVASSVLIGAAIILESALSYLGLGIQPPQASWGNMLTGAQNFVWTEPALAIYPGVLILITVSAFNYFGEGLRSAFNVTE
ncbi:MAG TPA: ABC transporter permease [Thermomicrobiaceae bacterium]|nr:ABC transporter permease [Thermomicrobiaceae bacterium]